MGGILLVTSKTYIHLQCPCSNAKIRNISGIRFYLSNPLSCGSGTDTFINPFAYLLSLSGHLSPLSVLLGGNC